MNGFGPLPCPLHEELNTACTINHIFLTVYLLIISLLEYFDCFVLAVLVLLYCVCGGLNSFNINMFNY